MASKTDTQLAQEALFLEWLDLLAASSGRSVSGTPYILFSPERTRIIFQIENNPNWPNFVLSLHRRAAGYPAVAAFEKEHRKLCRHFLSQVGYVFAFRDFFRGCANFTV
jgi:hypothetical protein